MSVASPSPPSLQKKGARPIKSAVSARIVACASLLMLLAGPAQSGNYDDWPLRGLAGFLQSGGPGPDGIPAMTNPEFVNPEEVDYVLEEDLVLGVVLDGEAKAYPENLGWWHEIINDRIADTFVSVTLCPLTGTGLVFDAEDDDGSQIEFGVSGLLVNSNLVMYDRRDGESLYPQMIYTGISGPFVEEKLELLPVVETTWSMWKRMHPDTKVAQVGTGLDRYSESRREVFADADRFQIYPYGDYRTNQWQLIFFPKTGELNLGYDPVAVANDESQIKNAVLGICREDQTKAYPFTQIPARAVLNDVVGETPLVVVYDAESRTAIPYSSIVDGLRLTFFRLEEEQEVATGLPVEFMDIETRTQWNMLGEAVAGQLEGARLEQLPAHNSMWFAWAAFWPDTEIWTGEGIIDADSVPPMEPTATAVEEDYVNAVPAAFALEQNFPNPFNPQTQIQFTVPADGLVRLTVHNNAGQHVSTLVNGQRAAGLYLVKWDGHGDGGQAVASGIYVYRFEIPDQGVSESRQMTLVR